MNDAETPPTVAPAESVMAAMGGHVLGFLAIPRHGAGWHCRSCACGAAAALRATARALAAGPESSGEILAEVRVGGEDVRRDGGDDRDDGAWDWAAAVEARRPPAPPARPALRRHESLVQRRPAWSPWARAAVESRRPYRVRVARVGKR